MLKYIVGSLNVNSKLITDNRGRAQALVLNNFFTIVFTRENTDNAIPNCDITSLETRLKTVFKHSFGLPDPDPYSRDHILDPIWIQALKKKKK